MDGLFETAGIPRVSPTSSPEEGSVAAPLGSRDNPFSDPVLDGAGDKTPEGLPDYSAAVRVKDLNLSSQVDADEYQRIKTNALRDAQKMKGFDPSCFVQVLWEDRYSPKVGGYHAVICWAEYTGPVAKEETSP